MQHTSTADAAAGDGHGLIERYGVDTIPDADRTSSPKDIVHILVGSNLAFGVVAFGWLPVAPATSRMAGTPTRRARRRRSPAWRTRP